MSYATSQIQFRILCFVNKAWTCFCLHIFVILVNNSLKSCFSVFIKCVINTMTQFILLVISHLFKIWLYSILIAKKKYMYHCTIVVSKTKTNKLCYFYPDFWHSNVGHSRHWKRKDWSLVILSSNRVSMFIQCDLVCCNSTSIHRLTIRYFLSVRFDINKCHLFAMTLSGRFSFSQYIIIASRYHSVS